MIARWLSEHRRLIGATSVLLVVAALALAAVAGSSDAPRGRPQAPSALAVTRRQLVVVQGELQRLQGLSNRQEAEITRLQRLSARRAAELSRLHAELRVRRTHHRTRHHRR